MVIGVCGLGHSGSGAVIDLLKEYDDIKVFSKCELSICYMPDGIEDLDYHINSVHSRYMSSDAAIYAYERLIKSRYGRNNFKHPAFYRDIVRETHSYIEKITQVKWRGTWAYRNYIDDEFRHTINVSILLKLSLLLHKYFHLDVNLRRLPFMRLSISPKDFDSITKDYMNSILRAIGKTEEDDKFVVDQLFSGDDPEKSFKYFDDPYAIVVKRDPRDVYLLSKHVISVYSRWIPTKNVEEFVEYYKILYGNSKYDSSTRVLEVQYEDLIYQYEPTVKKVEEFLGISKHTKEKEHFNPAYSERYTQLITDYPEEKEAIEYIEKNLSEFLYTFPIKNVVGQSKKGRIIV